MTTPQPARLYAEYADKESFEKRFKATLTPRRKAIVDDLVSQCETNPQHLNALAPLLQGLKAAKAVSLRELRNDDGPGIRIYLARRGNRLIIAGGGIKKTQEKDIKDAAKTMARWDRDQPAR